MSRGKTGPLTLLALVIVFIFLEMANKVEPKQFHEPAQTFSISNALLVSANIVASGTASNASVGSFPYGSFGL